MFKKLAAMSVAVAFTLAGCGTAPDEDTPNETPTDTTTTEDTPDMGLGGDMKFEYTHIDMTGEVDGEWIVSVYDVGEHDMLEGMYPFKDGEPVWPEDYTDAVPADGNKYVTVKYSIENTGTTPAKWDDVELLLSDDVDTYGQESETDSISEAITKDTYNNHERITDDALNPGKERTTITVFEVPEDFTPVFVLFYNPYGDGEDANGVMVG